MVQDEWKQIFPERMVSFILVNNSISRDQLQYTDKLIYTNNSDDVNAETLQSSERGHISGKLYVSLSIMGKLVVVQLGTMTFRNVVHQ